MTNQIDERRAEEIYKAMRWSAGEGTPNWVPNGNSLAQDEARKAARAIRQSDEAAGLIVAEPVTDEEVREVVGYLLNVADAYPSNERFTEAVDLIERLAAERDDAWRICATWRERAHAAEAKEIPAAEEGSE